ncbi:sulfurtransferase [Cellulomonas bogoriensis]|uniref:Sulfurtransferase n=1 Tax=Cellulomonas bogoriensis 69B4 = DSM 16987 TaxID=1386082 RepID=A0A0A0C1Z8_9CELL|nr:sulfurtransferase [Cellulomonas bogoriensis]KGM14201.1 thiosulfate sulfurtransferase [Cellulomonas bogoriensis 69B4 = DSM 16987]
MTPTRTRYRLAPAALAAVLLTGACTVAEQDPQGAETPDATATTDTTDGATPATGFDDVVVDADWLEAHLDDPSVKIIEVSTEPGLYERGHIPGATNFVWHTDFVDTVNRDIVDGERFTELVQAAGVDEDTTIVLYGDKDNWFAAWGAWVFDIYGAQDVRLLDGGRTFWENDGRELAVTPPRHEAGTWVAAEADDTLRSRLPDVLAVANGEKEEVLVDIRSVAEFTGEVFAPEGVQELAVRAGHIPGAVNVPWVEAVAEDGRFRSVEELREIYADAGVDGSTPITVYCRIGERASHTWFVLNKILGYEAAVYDGSWTEYGNTVGVPIENPAGTVWGGV